MKDKDNLTVKQAAFVDHYIICHGNATEAARRAGYKGNDNTLKEVGRQNLLKPAIASAIQKRMQPEKNKRIATADEILERLTSFGMGDLEAKPSEMIKALQILAKANGLLIDRSQVDVNTKVEIIDD